MNTKSIDRETSSGVEKLAISIVVAILLLDISTACAQEAQMDRGYVSRHKPAQQPSIACGDFNYGPLNIGPLDYRITPPDVRALVERRHFSSNVERLIKGDTGSVGGDISYTLRAFPNHPRALKAAAELTRRSAGKPTRMIYSLACWFDRAVAFRPDDVQVRILWAFELTKSKESAAALAQTSAAESLAKGDPAAHYNVALLYFELGEHEKAMANAKIAYDGGFNLPGLRNKLTKAGQWKE